MDQDFSNQNNYSVPKQPGSGFQVSEPKKSNKKNIIIAIIAAVLIILIGFTVVLATKIWDPLWNPFAPNPETVLKQAIENMRDIESMHTSAELNLVFDEPIDDELGADSIGLFLENDINNSNSQSDIDMSISGQDIEMIFGLQTKTVDDIFYFNVDTLPFLLNAYTMTIGVDLSPFQNKWYRFDSKELGMSMKGLNLSSEEKEALEQDLQNLYFQKPFLKVLKRLPEEAIDKKVSYHYLMSLDKENLKQFIVSLPEILENYFAEEYIDTENNEEEKQEMFDSIDKMFEKGAPEFEIWIGKKDKIIYRINWQGSYEFEKHVSSASDAMIKSAVNQARTQAELMWIYDSSYKNLCLGSDLNSNYSDSLKSIRDTVLSENSSMTCYANDNDYCISAKLQSKDGYFCVDSEGIVLETGGSDPCGGHLYCLDSGQEPEEKTEKNNVDIDLGIEFSQFNELIDITAPEESESIIQVLQGLMSTFYSSYN